MGSFMIDFNRFFKYMEDFKDLIYQLFEIWPREGVEKVLPWGNTFSFSQIYLRLDKNGTIFFRTTLFAEGKNISEE